MASKLTLQYDREGDILHIDKVAPYQEQDSEELGDDVVVRLNPNTGVIENLEIFFYSSRLMGGELLELPIVGDLRPAE